MTLPAKASKIQIRELPFCRFFRVALAAIQGLNRKLHEKDAEIQELKERLDRLEKIMQQNPNLAAGAWSSRSPLVVTTNNGVISTTVPATDGYPFHRLQNR